MTKLLTAYRNDQTDANLAKLNKHLDKHPMAGLYLTKDDIALIANHK
jgi:hypothetical protein